MKKNQNEFYLDVSLMLDKFKNPVDRQNILSEWSLYLTELDQFQKANDILGKLSELGVVKKIQKTAVKNTTTGL